MKVIDLFSQWQNSNNWARVEDSKHCHQCQNVYITGDIIFVFAAAAVDIKTGQYYCGQCGYKRLVNMNEKPAGMSIFVQQEHKTSEMELLPEHLQNRLVEACQIMDQIFIGLDKAYKEGKGISTAKAREQIKEAEEAGEEIPPAWRLN